jgi:murein DD-endopeptidase MepM/ murein hydrolase activator NlpD
MKRFNIYSGLAILILLLSACMGGGKVSYENIRPTYQVRNSPLPVPWPKQKPRSGAVSASAAKATQPTQPTIYSARGNNNEAIVGRTVTVQRGDTLYSISRILGVELKALIDANKLRAPYALAVGKVLSVPVSLHHTVAAGETTYGISRRYGVDMTRLARANNLRAPYSLHLGQRLQIPTSVNRSLNTVRRTNNRAVTASLPAREGSQFMWPTKGAVLSSFGPKSGGHHNDGINIRASHGAGVLAADAGVVAYAGADIKGFGKLLLVRHAGGWVTAYAHNDTLLVERGERVNRGQQIAKVGKTGGVTTPQLHFEVRRGTRAVDPIRYLTRR